EATLQEWLTTTAVPLAAPTAPRRRGRPPVLPAMLLWSGLLVCILRGFRAQLDLWRLLTQQGLWHFPRVNVCDMAVYKRLERSSPAGMQQLFERVTQAIQDAWPELTSVPYARFASAIVALDRTTLDPVLRKLNLLREVPAGTASLLAGALTCLFDVRRQ